MSILIKNGLVIDPVNKIEEIMDILVDGEKVSNIGRGMNIDTAELIDAKGKIVMPGIVDMHVHLREPGREDKETIASGTRAACKGGVTTVLAMPNTMPALDCAKNIKLLQDIIKKDARVDVFIAGAITLERLGKKLCDISALKKEGVIAITDDGSSVDKDELMSEALSKAKKEKLVVICHSEDTSLSRKGVVNRGFISTRLGLRGISSESEYKRVERDINLAEKMDASVHIAHVSCKESVEIIAAAKKKGIKVTAETAPHYFSLSDEALLDYNTNMKVNPPLRGSADVEAVKNGLSSGAIDVIASDHAPHTDNEKDIEFDYAALGTIGLETELAVCITELLGGPFLNWPELVRKLCVNPAKVLGIDKGSLGAGKTADIVIVSPEKEWIVKESDFVSKSRNSAFLGRKLKGVVEYTLYKGKVVYKNEVRS